MPQQIVSLWIGGGLGTIERLSLRSFVAQGHPVALYSYGEVTGVPAWVERRDAEVVLPRAMAETLRYANGSYALFSNMFRMELQRRALGVWVDADVVAMRELDIDGPFVVGRESDRFLNGAILKLSPESPVLRDWLATAASGKVPPWLPFHRAPQAWLRQATGARIHPSELPFGTFGPKSITALAARHGLTDKAQPEPVFYPLHPREATRLYDPTLQLASIVTGETRTIHLWNEKLGALKRTVPPEGSILAELLRRYPE
jgi:hypothetical protein